MTRSAALLALAALLAACTTNPHTGRSQLLLLSEDAEVEMGLEAFAQIGKEVRWTEDPAYVDPVRRVGKAIAAQAGKPDYQWEFRVIDDPKTVNAWCLPGGKIAFYTGIYPICEDENGMAIVMGHEVSHALLRHGGERVSQNIAVQGGLAATAVVARNSEHRDVALAALGAGAAVGFLLPYSRKHESEADKFGLMLAARAGYDPEAAIRVWQNMAKLGGGRPPEFLSTHPDPLRRIEDMRAWMPEARALYAKSNKQPNRPLPRPSG
ncbi:MAG: M48 family metallopeptidase [Planctomycetota bacterium]